MGKGAATVDAKTTAHAPSVAQKEADGTIQMVTEQNTDMDAKKVDVVKDTAGQAETVEVTVASSHEAKMEVETPLPVKEADEVIAVPVATDVKVAAEDSPVVTVTAVENEPKPCGFACGFSR